MLELDAVRSAVLRSHVAVGFVGLALFWVPVFARKGGPLAELAGRYWINAILGVIGLLGVIGDVRYLFGPRTSPMDWWYKHMECMLGAGIGFHAAFFVFGTARLLRIPLEGAWQLVPWLLPFAIGVPAMSIWIRYYERKFEGV